MQLKITKSLGLSVLGTALIIFTTSCSKSGSQVEGLSPEVNEFTAFHPVTGLPITEADLNEELLKEDEDSMNVPRGGEISTMEVHETNVDVEAVKSVMLLGYTPDGSYNNHLTPQCYHSEVTRMVSSYDGPTSNLAKTLQSWANRCERELSRYRTNPISTVLRFANPNYELTANTLKTVDIEFKDQSKIKALVGLKSGKRPLVIFKSGVYGNAEDGSVTKNFFMHLFEESPFHMVFLANVTGTDYMKDNGAVALGGMDEGRQIIKLVEMLNQDDRYKDLIEDVHVVGVSLGSHGVLYSSLYNSLSNSEYKIKSATALCPVVNLQPTIKSVFKVSVAGIYYAILTSQAFKEVYNHVPVLKQYLNSSGIWTQEQMYHASTQATLAHYKGKTEETPWDYAPYVGRKVSSLEDFWEYNNFINQADKVTTPTLIVHSRDDFLVQSAFNSDDLLRKTQNDNSQIGIVEFQNGAHCGLNVATGWGTISSMLRSFILKHSTYKEETGEKMAVSFKSPTMNSNHKISKFTFAAEKNKSQAEVEIEYFDASLTAPGGKSCKRFDPLFAAKECYRKKTEKVDLSLLASLGVKVPQSSFETQRLTRWLNTHATLVNKNSEVILGSNLWPTSIEVDSKPDFQN